jgi:hypothetical protein
MVRVIASVVGLVLCIAAPQRARAGDDDPAPDDQSDPAPPDDDAPEPAPAHDPKEAKRWMTAGDTLIKGGDKYTRRGKTAEAQSQYERALVSYEKAYELSGNPQVFYAIAAAEEKLGKTHEALLHYRAVTLQVTDNPKLIELANQRLGALSQDVGLLTATIDPEGANLALDGDPVGTSPMSQPLVLAPGTYTLQITADGFQPMEVKLLIEGGSESERTFKLEPVPVVFDKPKQAPKPIARPKTGPAPSKLLVWVGLGATLALSGVATTTGVLALSRHKTFEDPDATPAERESARDSGKKLSLTTDLCLAGAVIAAGFTTYYYFGVYRPRLRKHRKPADRNPPGARRTREEAPKVVVAPWVQPSIGGIAIAVTY